MGGIGGQYGPYVMYVLSQLLQKRRNEENSQSRERSQNSENLYKDENMQNSEIFSSDETGAAWHREENTEILKQFCREGYAQAKKHGHFIVGSGPNGNYIGIPGRFLIEEQPAGGATGFTLWQPLAGGDACRGGCGKGSPSGYAEVPSVPREAEPEGAGRYFRGIYHE